MASEYLKKKYQDVKPEAKRELTPRERRANWFHYHKWHIVIGAALLAIPLSILWNVLTVVEPDCQVAYVGTHALPDDTAAALEEALSALCADLNGDGRQVVRLVQYASGGEAQAAYADQVRLMADLLECESSLFLLEDPEGFQRDCGVLCRLDGTLPEEGEEEGLALAWERCPVLAGLELGDWSYPVMGETVSGSSQELLGGLFLARRGYQTEKTAPYPEGCEALWEKLTEGAVS